MAKAIAFLRTSTDRQDIEAQRKELIGYLVGLGYTEDRITTVGDRGGSAIKEDALYLQFIGEIKDLLATGEYDTVGCWEVSRIARHRTTFYSLLDAIKAVNANFVVSTFNLSLKDNTGAYNVATDLNISIMVTMAENEMQLKQKRFARSRKDMAEKGLYLGSTIPYGYKVENKKIIEDEETSKIIVELFTLYATGKYSVRQVARELQQRGYSRITERFAFNAIRNPIYIGEPNENSALKRRYPPIISKDLWDKCREIAKAGNTKADKQSKHYFFGRKLVKCPVCGHNMTAGLTGGYAYRCTNHKDNNNNCSVTWQIGAEIIDGLLWDIAKEQEINYLTEQGANRKLELLKEIELLNIKIDNAQPVINRIKAKRQRVIDAYLDTDIDKPTRDSKLKKIDEEAKNTNAQVLRWQEEVKAIEAVLNTPTNSHSFLLNLTHRVNDNIGEKKMQEIVRKHIKEVRVDLVFNELTKWARTGKRYYNIEIETVLGDEYKFVYHPHRKHKLYRVLLDGTQEQVIYAPYIFRLEEACYTLDSYYYYRNKGVIKVGDDTRIDNIIKYWLERITKAEQESRNNGYSEYIESEEYQQWIEQNAPKANKKK